MSGGRFALFLTVVLSVWTAMHLYVFWRLRSVPGIGTRVPLVATVAIAAALWSSYPLARILHAQGLRSLALPMEWLGANWIGVLFLAVCALLAVDLVTMGGWVLTRSVPVLRGGAVLLAVGLSVVAFIQGCRDPVVRDFEVHFADLPAERDGLTVLAISDLHLGTVIGSRWMEQLVQRVNTLRPDIVVLVGDILESTDESVEREIIPQLRQLRPPLGWFAVTGNHEFYAGVDLTVALMQSAGGTVLRDRWIEVVPGLVLAGLDDLTARQQQGLAGGSVEQALAGRPRGAVVLLSHTPWQADAAAASGADLMISGHTHAGQIWPFGYLVGRRYPLLAGRYEVGGMPVIVGRGTGTWGPRMRLWQPGEMLRIRLRSGRVLAH